MRVNLQDAERLARQRVIDLCPELAAVQPTVAPRRRHAATPGQLSRLAMSPAGRAFPEPEEITFTYAGELRTPDGDRLPRVARVTVSASGEVVRAVISQ